MTVNLTNDDHQMIFQPRLDVMFRAVLVPGPSYEIIECKKGLGTRLVRCNGWKADSRRRASSFI